MRLLHWIKSIFKGKMNETELFRQGAFHECGHVAMAYMSQFKATEISLIKNDPGSGFTRFDYGDQRITLLIAAMKEYSTDPTIFRNLDPNLKKAAPQVAFKIVGTLLAGPVSEAFLKVGVDFKGNLPVEVSGPDLLTVQSIDQCLTQNFTGYPNNYIQDTLYKVTELIRSDDVWNPITNLAERLLSSPDKHLNQIQIEDSLQTSGNLDFIK